MPDGRSGGCEDAAGDLDAVEHWRCVARSVASGVPGVTELRMGDSVEQVEDRPAWRAFEEVLVGFNEVLAP